MTAAVTVETGPIRAPRGARLRALVGAGYVGVSAGAAMARATRFGYIVDRGEAAAAGAVVASSVCIALALLVLTIRSARVTIDEDGLRWGWGAVGFRLARARIAGARVYADAVAISLTRGTTWYLSARDYAPYGELVAALGRAGLELRREPGRAPLRARLQAYGLALDVILLAAVLGATAVFLVA
jgi:hypothetical protein